jgi:hypothetical protein
MPTKKELLNQTTTKIIIANIDNSKIKTAISSSLGSSLASNLNSILSSGKNVRILKRVEDSISSKIFTREIQISELTSKIPNIEEAEYIITGAISDASFDDEFHKGYYSISYINGRKRGRYISSMVKSTACVSGHLKVFKIPSLKEELSVPFDKCTYTQKDVEYRRIVKVNNNSMVRQVGRLAIKEASFEIKNFFAKKGYIYEARKKDNKIIVNTTLGSSRGALKGMQVNIFSIKKTKNALTNIKYTTSTKIGTGTISNQITSNSSWIIIDELDTKRLYIGNI